MRAGINALTAAFVVGILCGLLLTPDGRGWLRRPTLMLGSASASASANASTSDADGTETEVSATVAPATAKAPATPPSRPVTRAVTPLDQRLAQGRLRIGVFGDSMGDGLWTALYRDLNGKDGVTVEKFSEVSTGLSRYDYVDVHAKTARQLREKPIDAAVILFGTNDAQGISLDGQIHAFGTPGWRAAYGRRIDDLVALMRSQDVAVYWVGLPRMKRASFDDRMSIINAVVEERMTALGVPLIETTTATSSPTGDYEAYLPGQNGRPQLMRANDGIHMTMAGYLRIAEPVLARLKRDAGLTGNPDPAG